MGLIQDSAEKRMHDLRQEIMAMDREINDLQNEFYSLVRFKGSVQGAQKNSSIANDQRRLILRGLNGLKKNNTVAEKYQSGMDDQLIRVGKFVVDDAFSGFLRRIDRKLEALSNQIGSLKSQRFMKEWEYNSLDIVF